ncbi:MAG: paraquat-inducible protein A [Halioglobus sp.]|nr:paraquat-inducible protein A [Halioglobus sp.]
MSGNSATAASRNLAACDICYKLAPAQTHNCPRCGAALHLRKRNSLQHTLALLITACILYIPANTYPIMYMDQFGSTESSTIIGGVVELIALGSIPIAVVIFAFSVIVPSAKIMVLFYLVWTVENHSPLSSRQRGLMYRIVHFIGKWSMLDVFVVAIMAALVHLGDLLVVRPGIAALSFAGVVILTMIAAHRFDSRLIWDTTDDD